MRWSGPASAGEKPAARASIAPAGDPSSRNVSGTSRRLARMDRALSDGRILPRSIAEIYEIENSGEASCDWVNDSLGRTSRMFLPTRAATARPTLAASSEAMKKYCSFCESMVHALGPHDKTPL